MALATSVLASCEALMETGEFEYEVFSSAEELLEGATFVQYDYDKTTGEYTEAEKGNYVKYEIPSVSAVVIYVIKSNGSTLTLASGSAAGMFYYLPSRGSDELQTIYFSYTNVEGTETIASIELTFNVQGELSPETLLLVSNSGTKTWKWNLNSSRGWCWGNCGNTGSYGHQGAWWGVNYYYEVDSLGEGSGFYTQLAHAGSEADYYTESYGYDADPNAYMIFTEDGEIIKYDANGKKIGSGTFSVEDYDAEGTTGYSYGTLIPTAGALLWPYEINSGGNKPTWFYIDELSTDILSLYYPDGGDETGIGEWGECTYWEFTSASDVEGLLSGNDEATWTWAYDGGSCWGNCGYAAGVSTATSVNGQWWGITPDGIAEQIEGYGYTLDDSEGATMTFNADGTLTKSSGGKGTYTFDTETLTDLGGNESTTYGRLYTTGDGILMPVQINCIDNGGGLCLASEFDIEFISSSFLVLANQASWNSGSWVEATFWRFQKVTE